MCSSHDPSSLLLQNSSTLSATELDAELCHLHRLGAQVKLRYIALLLHLDEARLFKPLGFGDVFQYAERRFGYGRAETYQHLRVAQALRGLPLLTRAYGAGETCWSAVKSLTRIAQPETESSWLAFAHKKSVVEIRSEVEAALAERRELPRKEGRGLPRIKVQLCFTYSPEELAVVQTALRKVTDEVKGSLGGERLLPHQALLYLAGRVLETDAVSCGERVEADASPYTVVLQTCPRCKEGSVQTDDGPVAVPGEILERVAADAGVVDLEQELRSQSSVRRRVLLRDACRCANPLCRRHAKHLHAHHIVWRSQGGETSVRNELLVCSACHANLHAGFLRVAVDAQGTPVWTTALDALDQERTRFEDELAAVVVPAVFTEDKEQPGSRSLDLEALERALVKLGYRRREARERLEMVVQRLGQTGIDLRPESVLKEALKG